MDPASRVRFAKQRWRPSTSDRRNGVEVLRPRPSLGRRSPGAPWTLRSPFLIGRPERHPSRTSRALLRDPQRCVPRPLDLSYDARERVAHLSQSTHELIRSPGLERDQEAARCLRVEE